MKKLKTPIKRLFSIKLIVMYSLVILILGFALLGFAYAQERKKQNQLLDKSTHDNAKSGGAEIDNTYKPSIPQEGQKPGSVNTPTSGSNVDTPTNGLPANNSPQQSQTSPKVFSHCESVAIPYKHSFVKGTGPYTLGSAGTNYTCHFTGGYPPETTVFPAINQVNYINVTAQDDANINNICSHYPSEYYNQCAAVVRYDP